MAVARSVNNVFISIIAQTMGNYTSPERQNRKRKMFHFDRRKIGVGTIVDIRDASAQPLDRVFNLYLSSYSIMLDNPEKRSTVRVWRSLPMPLVDTSASFAAMMSMASPFAVPVSRSLRVTLS